LTDDPQDIDGLARLLLAKGERVESLDHLLGDDEGTDLTGLVDVPDAEPTVIADVNLNLRCSGCAQLGHTMSSPACPLSETPNPASTLVRLPVLPRPPRLHTQGGYTENEKQMRRALKDPNAENYPDDVERPVTRGDCHEMPRPCPFVSCSHHLALDVNPDTGVIKLNFPNLEIWEMPESCSLDVADKGGITLEEVGAIMNLTRERIRQVEVGGFQQIKDHAGSELGIPPER
jgi:hypothetical protein